jgi:hypothetical protein
MPKRKEITPRWRNKPWPRRYAYAPGLVGLGLMIFSAGCLAFLVDFDLHRWRGLLQDERVWLAAGGAAFFWLGFIIALSGTLQIRRWSSRPAETSVGEGHIVQDYAWSPLGIGDDTENALKARLWTVVTAGGMVAPFHLVAFVSAPSIFALSNNERNIFTAGVILFILVFFGLVDWFILYHIGDALRWGRQRLYFGKIWVRFSKFPYHPGEMLTVTFEGGEKLKETQLSVVLRRIEEKLVPQEDTMHLACCEVYADQRECATDTRGYAAIAFPLPENAIGTCFNQREPTYWELAIKARPSGISYEGIFYMPVYGRGE